MIHRRPISSSALPPISMGRAVVRPTNGAAAPYGHARGSHCRVWLRNDWFACLGRRKETHRKTERWAGPCPQVGEPASRRLE